MPMQISQTVMPVGETRSRPDLTPVDATNQNADAYAHIERLLWTEMLSHAGFEDALVSGGGEQASAFARYVVEAIAADLATSHPFIDRSVVGGAKTGGAGADVETVR